jgi:hypothetical protein
LIDPPREGAVEVVKALPRRDDEAALKRIVYVSCNPATLARDASVLVATAAIVSPLRRSQHVSAHGACRINRGVRTVGAKKRASPPRLISCRGNVSRAAPKNAIKRLTS